MTGRNMTTRRGVLRGLGGIAAGYRAAIGAGGLPKTASAALPDAPPDVGKGKRVLVLGAGVGGICTAYELEKLGYGVTILEASGRAGGRSLTLRRGDTFREMGGPVQVCDFEEKGWMNAGPGRIPWHHTHVIDYCRELGVELIPYIYSSNGNLTTRGPAGEPMPRPPVAQGRLVHDLRGQIAAKLDQCMKSANAPWDIEYSAMLETFGGLTRAKDDPGNKEPWPYENIEGRAGYNVPPGLVFDTPEPLPPEGLAGMVGSQAWKSSVFNDTLFDWQSSLMQPAGGMDMFWKGFLARTLRNNPARKVGSLIVYNAAVRGIDIRDRKVEVAVSQSGRNRMETADYCVSTIPMPIFTALKTNIDAAVMTAARALKPVPAGKVGWQAERFWEKEYHIFGGISWVQGLASQVWYPSDAFLSRLGVLTGAYMNAAPAARFNAMPIAQRMDVSRAAIDGLHPGAGKLLRHGVAIGWNNMEHLKMGWIDENDDAFVENAAIAARPVANRLFQAGDQLTRLSGWQEGAILMARKAIADIVQATRGG